jgi:hypothetical protein
LWRLAFRYGRQTQSVVEPKANLHVSLFSGLGHKHPSAVKHGGLICCVQLWHRAGPVVPPVLPSPSSAVAGLEKAIESPIANIMNPTALNVAIDMSMINIAVSPVLADGSVLQGMLAFPADDNDTLFYQLALSIYP